MRLTDDSETFRSENGHFVILPQTYGDTVLLSSDGSVFYETKQTGYGSHTGPGFIKQDISYEDPHHNIRGQIMRENDQLELDGMTFRKVVNPLDVTVIPLPSIRIVQFFYQIPNGEFIYIDDDKYSSTYASHRFFIGNGVTMRQLPITGFERLRDGGTTYVTTGEGMLYSPSPFRRNEKSTWNGMPLVELHPQNYAITETEDGLIFTN